MVKWLGSISVHCVLARLPEDRRGHTSSTAGGRGRSHSGNLQESDCDYLRTKCKTALGWLLRKSVVGMLHVAMSEAPLERRAALTSSSLAWAEELVPRGRRIWQEEMPGRASGDVAVGFVVWHAPVLSLCLRG
jgi:hypothetical protein